VASDTCADAPLRIGTEGGEDVCPVPPGSTEGAGDGEFGVADGLADGVATMLGEGEDTAVDEVVIDGSGSGSDPEQPEVASIATMPTQATPRRTGIHTQKG